MAFKLDFSIIRKYTKQQLYDLGFLQHGKPDRYHLALMLFPAEYYNQIPEGFRVITISGEVNAFSRATKYAKYPDRNYLSYWIRVMT